MAVIAGIGTREYYRSSGYHLEDTYMVKDLTVERLHAGRADLLADQPIQLRIEHQDMQQAASALFLPLPPKVPHMRQRETQGSRRKARGKARDADAAGSTAADAAAVQETDEKAKAFLTEYTVGIEEIDVVALLSKLRDTEMPHSEPGEPGVLFADSDTFTEWCGHYTVLKEKQKNNTRSKFSFLSLPWRLYSWLYWGDEDASNRRRTVLAGAVTSAAVACSAVGILWVLSRRRHSP